MQRYVLIGLLIIFSLAITVQASEVAEAAKKEKARRQALQQSKQPAKVFTNQDIANLKSTLAFESTQPAKEQEQSDETKTLPAANNTEIAPTEEQQPANEQNEETERLKEEREDLERQAQDAQNVINQGGGYHTRNIGNQFKSKREAESRIREIDQELAEKEKEKEKEPE
jgi:hypothetical protein